MNLHPMKNKFHILLLLVLSVLGGCATTAVVPMASKDQDVLAKTFPLPPADKAGLYIYRNGSTAWALKKRLSIDKVYIGETAIQTYYYKVVNAGLHTISTESEFSDNNLELQAEGGKNYFIRQYMKIGVFKAAAGLALADENKGKDEVLECQLAR